MYKINRVKSVSDAKLAESYIFEAIKPGGFADSNISIPSLKDQLAWLSWANLRRPEQPSFVVKENNGIIAGIFGEPVENWFDVGEAEIQEFLILPGYEERVLVKQLLDEIISFYDKSGAKQVHFWIPELDFKAKNVDLWRQMCMEDFGFSYQGFSRASKWSGKKVMKIEKHF